MIDEVKVMLPYPEVSGEIAPRELGMLYDLYAGRFSEMTAITSYTYQSVIARADHRVKDLIESISINEMRHLELLANAIYTFGGDPVFAGRHNFFSGSYTNYEKDVVAFLTADIESENLAASEYRKGAESTNESLNALLSRIALDEEYHATLLSDLLATLREESMQEN